MEYFEANRQLWNAKTAVHTKSDFYALEAFKKGKSSLNSIEIEALGDVKDKSILHLQCHFGQDTLSFQRMGAHCTGIDLSDEAITYAKNLNQELNLDANFVCSNVYDLDKNLNGKFDIVFTSYGVVGWLPNLSRWAQIISKFLKENGTFYMVEFHPMVWMYNHEFTEIEYSYFNTRKPIVEELEGTYADRNADIKKKEYTWNHSLSEVVNALLNEGLKIQSLDEFPFSAYDIFPDLEQDADGYWRMKKYPEMIPMMYAIAATKA